MRTIVPFVFILVIILSLRFFNYYTSIEPYTVGDRVVLEHTFLREGRIGGYSQSFRVDEVTVIVPLYPRYEYGDVVRVTGAIENQVIEFDDGEEFARLVIKNPEVERIENSNFLLSFTSSIRQKIIYIFEKFLPPDQSGLLLGIVFGVREGIRPELDDIFRNTGILHVVAASGANVALVGGFFFVVFRFLSSNTLRVMLVTCGIAFYALLSGGEASILRAALMAVFAYSAGILGRQYSAYYGLAFAAFLLLLIDPQIWEDIGFLLSLTSTFGIVALQVPISKILSFGKVFPPVEDMTTSLAATIGNVPILLFFFSTYPVLSILVNVLVLWTVPYLMILGGLGAFFGLIYEPLALPFLYLSLPLLSFFLWAVQLFPQDIVIDVGEISVYFVLGYYLILIAGIIFIRKIRVKD